MAVKYGKVEPVFMLLVFACIAELVNQKKFLEQSFRVGDVVKIAVAYAFFIR